MKKATMIPVGKLMAQALLEESDESTVSLSDLESIEGEPGVSTTCPNSGGRPFMSFQVDRGVAQATTFKAVATSDPNFEQRSRSSWNVSPFSHITAFPSMNHRIACSTHHYAALDCEMVGVGPGGSRSVLARVAIVDFFGNRLLDEFVRVEERVTDYRHHITGISEKDLSGPKAISYGLCRRLVIENIRGKILVGHALQNDLHVLGIHHPWHCVRDTATYHQFMKRDRYGRVVPNRLRDLAKIHLQAEIQVPGRPHCPLEDARAAMALYKMNQAYWDQMVAGTIPQNLRYPTMDSHGSRIYN